MTALQDSCGPVGRLDMESVLADADLLRFLAVTPFEQPDLSLARALWRQNIAAAINIGRRPAAWPALLAAISNESAPGLGLCIPDGVDVGDLELPRNLRFLIADAPAAIPEKFSHLPVLVQVCSVAEAEQALRAGAAGLIAKGQESGGRVGDESSYVLLQRIVPLAEKAGRPVWCQGGIGLNTAAGVFAAGAFGVVLDAILALYPESSLPDEVKAQVLAMDGSEVRHAAGYQIYARGARENGIVDTMDAEAMRTALSGAGEFPLIPMGQDAALAKPVMAECPTLETLINSLRMRVAGQLRQARLLRVLDEGNAWAKSHGTRYPVAQGPMTRVSDTAAFCGAVSDAGGLPFLALSLMQQDSARALLEAARARVGNQTWGVGVLGFAPPEILNPHLELVKEIKPSVLFMAGGRPSQARPFVEMGIPTYLHVPSPGLLELFLKDGSTHFVFEGRECGGHVGPRYSFVLWEQALSILQNVEHPEKLHILFAGGIHDERSSAMVAAIAAPLAARGAKIGVLMGTAYITTREVVSCGGVTDNFQKKALNAHSTTLVETAPGHAIRCLPSGFIELFRREKARMSQMGVEIKEAWRKLEELVVGRLRIATKGVEYQDGVLSPVDRARQEAEGMYMIGQLITMRNTITTVAELHAAATVGATRYLDALAVPALHRQRVAKPVAIVGMACIFPGSPDLETYWANILEGRDLVGEVPAERWSAEQFYQAGAAAPGKTPSKWGGFISDTPFDPLQYGIPPQSLAAIEPAQLLSLEVANQAIKDAGYGERYFDREKTSVIFGAESSMELGSQYNFRNMFPQYCGEIPEALDRALPSLTEDSFPGVLVNVIAGRIANRLGLGGVNYAVDSACASSLTAVELAMKELRAGTSDMVLAGGADFHNGIGDFLMFSSVGALSPTGRCRPFDNRADGICLGEGVGVVVLKRLEDAERDGDRIYAVIDGVAGSSDGKGLGLTAPRKEGQKRALDRAYWQAGVLPGEIGLVEAHGTGTVVGDRTELKTLTEIYAVGGAVPAAAQLGSVKSQIGHTKCAAGIAGLIKVAKALHHRVLPPTTQIVAPNTSYKPQTSPFQLNLEPTPWLADAPRAALSAFGFGGTNFHAVLSAHTMQGARGANVYPAELFAIRGDSFELAAGVLRKVEEFVSRSTANFNLRDLANAAWQAGSGPVQCAFVATDVAALKRKLGAAIARKNVEEISFRAPEPVGKIAYLFSGQGSQYPGMLRDLFVYSAGLQKILAAGRDYLPILFPATAYDEETRSAQQRELTDTRNAQPALGMVEMALFDWLSAIGLKPDMAGGHSFGELSALASAGAFDTETLLRVARARADAIFAGLGDDPGCMAAVSLGADALKPLLADFPNVVLANQNSPSQTVISGPTAEIKAACESLKQQSVGCKQIDTACAFHSPMVAAAEEGFALTLRQQPIGRLNWPVYSNTTAAPYADDAENIRHGLARQIVSPVRFVDEVERMYVDGARVFIEVGPRKVLTGLVGRILKDRPHDCIALDGESKGLAGMLESIARLAVLVPGFDAAALFAARSEMLNLAEPRLLAATTWMVNGGRARPLKGAAPVHAGAAITAPVVSYSAITVQGAPGNVANADQQVLLSYLTNMREMVNAQRDVLMNYFNVPGERTVREFAPVSVVAARPVAQPALAAPPAEQQPSKAAPDVRTLLLSIVSDRTGYPAEMLDLDLDLEADLSIDSIKRLEIVSQLTTQLSVDASRADKDVMLESLAALKTLRAMIAWLEQRGTDGAKAATVADALRSESKIVPLSRYVMRSADAPAAIRKNINLAGQQFVITDDGLGLAPAVAALLRQQGATSRIVGFSETDAAPGQLDEVDGLIHLWTLNPANRVRDVKRFFNVLRQTLVGKTRCLMVASGLGGDFGAGAGAEFDQGAGLAGLIKSVDKEFPDARARLVDLNLAEPLDQLAAYIEQELLAEDDLTEVAYKDGKRRVREAVPAMLQPGAHDEHLPLDESSVLLITGGARGITAHLAVALAMRHRCHLEIIGRSPPPTGEESAATRDVRDARLLRQALMGDATRKPGEIERLVKTILAERDFRDTMERIRAAGGRVNYTPVDVRDEDQFSAFIASLYAKHGRIDGVIHGAGVVEDKLLRHKSADSFERVFDTKVSGALVLNRQIRDDVKFVVFFSSVAGAFGNKGQADYAAANDVLDKIAHAWQERIDGQVLSVNWGPWADTGMVSESLEKEFNGRGIGLIPPQEGVDALLRELSVGRDGDTQVVLMCGKPESFSARPQVTIEV